MLQTYHNHSGKNKATISHALPIEDHLREYHCINGINIHRKCGMSCSWKEIHSRKQKRTAGAL